jgi:hypothetical protein
MVTRQQRINDFDSAGEPPAGELMELLAKITMALMCSLFLAFGLTARGVATGPTVRLKPTSLGGEGNEDRARY